MLYAVAVLAGMVGALIMVSLMKVNSELDEYDEGFEAGYNAGLKAKQNESRKAGDDV